MAAREEVFNMPIVSLPIGGRMIRIAWGRIIPLSDFTRERPSADAASVWPSSTD